MLGFDANSKNYSLPFDSQPAFGVGCCVSLGKGPHIFIMAPTEEDLETALVELQISPEEKSGNKELAAVYPVFKERVVPQSIWVYHAESDIVFVSDRNALRSGELQEIGPAKNCTTIEAKRALLACGWSREDAREVIIKSDQEA